MHAASSFGNKAKRLGVSYNMRVASVYVLLLMSVLVLARSFASDAKVRPTYGLSVLLTHNCTAEMDDLEITVVDVQGHGQFLRNDQSVGHDVLRQQIRQMMGFRHDAIVWVTGSADATQGEVVQLESELAADTPWLVLANVTEAQLRPMRTAMRERRSNFALPFCTPETSAIAPALRF